MTERNPRARGQEQVEYFKRRNPFNRLTLRLSVAAMVMVVAWIFTAGVLGHKNLYSPGDLSSAHAFIEKDCTSCHSGSPGATLSRSVDNAACQKCHVGTIHHFNQVVAGRTGGLPQCSTCHEEHRGRSVQPTLVSDSRCVQCHENLPRSTVGPAGGFAAHITSFSSDHPEFRIVAAQQKDQAAIKLNHQKHLRQDLPGPNGRAVQMQCTDCHHLQENGNVAPIEFQRDCASCHSLAFDERIRESAPHEEPAIVAAFIRTAYSKYTGKNPNEWKTNVAWRPARKLAELRLMVDDAPQNLPQWVEGQITAAQRLLFEKQCQECHIVEKTDAAIPAIIKPEIPSLWLRHARFSHTPHRMLGCESCHKGARTSSATSDVLLPSRNDCLRCHNPSAAPNTCVTCHDYHGAANQP